MQLRAKIFSVFTIATALAGCQSSEQLASLTPTTMVASTPMPTGSKTTDLPAGFASFCLRFADQCTDDPKSPATIALDPTTTAKLLAVNTEVNRAIWPEDDQKHYGRAEYWTIPTDGRGDCDDYAVTKRAELIAAGLPENALRLATVITPRAVRHAVLTVATDHGDYVLDSLTNRVLPWSSTQYEWLERQSASNARDWLSLTGKSEPNVMTAALASGMAKETR